MWNRNWLLACIVGALGGVGVRNLEAQAGAETRAANVDIVVLLRGEDLTATPVPFLRIRLARGADQVEAVTDAEGKAVFRNVALGSWRLTTPESLELKGGRAVGWDLNVEVAGPGLRLQLTNANAVHAAAGRPIHDSESNAGPPTLVKGGEPTGAMRYLGDDERPLAAFDRHEKDTGLGGRYVNLLPPMTLRERVELVTYEGIMGSWVTLGQQCDNPFSIVEAVGRELGFERIVRDGDKITMVDRGGFPRAAPLSKDENRWENKKNAVSNATDNDFLRDSQFARYQLTRRTDPSRIGVTFHFRLKPRRTKDGKNGYDISWGGESLGRDASKVRVSARGWIDDMYLIVTAARRACGRIEGLR